MNSEETRKALVEAIESLVRSPDDEEQLIRDLLWVDVEKAMDALEDTFYDSGYDAGKEEGYDEGAEASHKERTSRDE